MCMKTIKNQMRLKWYLYKLDVKEELFELLVFQHHLVLQVAKWEGWLIGCMGS